jgi:hypothetical protein
MLEALIEVFLHDIVINLLCRLASLVVRFARRVKKCWNSYRHPTPSEPDVD